MKANALHQQADTLQINWSNGKVSSIPYIWLYDNHPAHRHINGQKLTETVQLDLNVSPLNAQLREAELQLQWELGKTAVYSLQAIYDQLFPKNLPEPIYWNQASISKVEYSWHYEEIINDKVQKKSFLESVIRYGFALLKGLPPEDQRLLEVVDWFGFVRQTNYGICFDVKSVPEPNNLAYTALGLPPHTDNPYRDPVPTLQLLHCLKADADGGASTLMDGFKIAHDLKQENPGLHHLLASRLVRYRFQDADNFFENDTTIIGVDRLGKCRYIRFNNRSVQPFELEDSIRFYEAYQAFESKLHAPHYRLRFKLAPGELILFDNERILHGREAYTLTGERHLQGCYADRDGLYSRWRKLADTKRS